MKGHFDTKHMLGKLYYSMVGKGARPPRNAYNSRESSYLQKSVSCVPLFYPKLKKIED